MKTKNDIEKFLSGNSFALCGLSRSGKKFSNMIFDKMKELNYTVYPVNPNAELIGKTTVFDSLNQIPKDCNRVIIITPKIAVMNLINEAIANGINDIWVQQGTENDEIVEFSNNHPEYNIIYGYCLWMFISPKGFPHNLHKGILQLLNKYPK